jgi:hypothetical protein
MAAKVRKKRECEVCNRKEGSTKDRDGEEDGIPLPVGKCGTCGRLACSDCMHEADCCFAEEDDHADDPSWAPPGWRRVSVTAMYEKI